MSEPGLYPIVLVQHDWYLDKGCLHPVLRLTRSQLPLMPAFAMTAHAAQGQTFSNGAIVDLRLGGSSSAMASYVGIVWRGEDIIWARLEEEHMPKKYCPGCYRYKPKQDYHLCEWNKDNERGNCKDCIKRRTKEGTPYECNNCYEWFCKEAFDERQRDHRSTHTRTGMHRMSRDQDMYNMW